MTDYFWFVDVPSLRLTPHANVGAKAHGGEENSRRNSGRDGRGRAALCADAGEPSVVRGSVAGGFRAFRWSAVRRSGALAAEDCNSVAGGRNADLSGQAGRRSQGGVCCAGCIDCRGT